MDWKLWPTTLAPFYRSYVELASFLAIFLLVAGSMAVRRRRQLWRHVVQVLSLFVFFFLVSSCLGVFGLIRNALRGLAWVGRDDLRAFYWLSITAVVLALTFNFGAVFCGWICPTGTLQEFVGKLSRLRRRGKGREREGTTEGKRKGWWVGGLTLAFGLYGGVVYEIGV